MGPVGYIIEAVRPRLYQNGFVQENPGASPYNLESLKGFVREMAFSVDGMEGNDTAAVETVRNYWNCFSTRWRRKNPEIPTNISVSYKCMPLSWLS
jgi:hypothetical protein